MRINLVLPPPTQGGILEKFAVRLQENTASFGHSAAISEDPDPSADINHWMIYHIVKGDHLPGSFLITHVDSVYRLQMICRAMDTTNIGICLSSETRSFLTGKGIDPNRTCYIIPGTDAAAKPRRIIIGLTTHIYDNHCKREEVLLDAVKKIPLDLVRFEIYGKGWEAIIPKLESRGAEVVWEKPSADYLDDYQKITQRLPYFDYYLYMGLDEGSMGFLDALAAGIPTIVTPQGFHLDIPNGITYPFFTADQLAGILKKLQDEKRGLVDSVKERTWHDYTHRHVVVWQAILDGFKGDYQSLVSYPSNAMPNISPDKQIARQEKWNFYTRPIRNLLTRLIKR
ncbi:MAG TPA: hypothetical protein VN376_07345 [Longilinea sp.]|nr:hypothetical protein [Longilinea sp.]